MNETTQLEEIKIGTLLFNKRFNLVGRVDRVIADIYYSVDSDDEYYWTTDEIVVIGEKEFLARRLKNDERMGGAPDSEEWEPFK
jgi:hypothetical protein